MVGHWDQNYVTVKKTEVDELREEVARLKAEIVRLNLYITQLMKTITGDGDY